MPATARTFPLFRLGMGGKFSCSESMEHMRTQFLNRVCVG